MLIQLHYANRSKSNGKAFHINYNHIKKATVHKEAVWLDMIDGDTFRVKESIEEINKLYKDNS